MITEILPDIFKIDVPLPQNPLKSTNAYFIRNPERNLLIDTGFNCDASKNAMNEALNRLDAHMENTDLFITHLHSDHSGLVEYLATPATTVWMSQSDAELIIKGQNSQHWHKFSDFIQFSGLLASGMENNLANHPGIRYSSGYFDRFTMVTDGFEILAGDYIFQCLETRGHTAGHICLYEANKKILISGDHILGKITPNITLWHRGEGEDVLGDYLNSLDKVDSLDISIVLPGHRSIITDCQGRIAELKSHHQRRLDNIMNILNQGRMNPADVAKQMQWDLSYNDWEEFPWGQKLFATGEAMSHLYHLVVQGRVIMTADNGIIYFEQQ